MKHFKIVYGFNELDYIPITSEELVKAQFISMYGGKANFEAGFFNNRGNDVMRIQPDYNKAMGWNVGHKIDSYDMAEIRESGIEKQYKKTMENAKMLAEDIHRQNKLELLSKPSSLLYHQFKQLSENNNKQLN